MTKTQFFQAYLALCGACAVITLLSMQQYGIILSIAVVCFIGLFIFNKTIDREAQ